MFSKRIEGFTDMVSTKNNHCENVKVGSAIEEWHTNQHRYPLDTKKGKLSQLDNYLKLTDFILDVEGVCEGERTPTYLTKFS